MTPKLVLIYFDIPGIAEPIRWALTQSCLEWEDKRLSREEFDKIKSSFPNGQLPVLEVDGYPLSQSVAILRYVGKLGGLYPIDYLEAAKCDAVIDSVSDLFNLFRPIRTVQDEAKKMEMKAEFESSYIPSWLEKMEKKIGHAAVHFLDKMTIADIMFATVMTLLKSGKYVTISSNVIDAYPKLVALTESIMAEPKIAEFIAKTGSK